MILQFVKIISSKDDILSVGNFLELEEAEYLDLKKSKSININRRELLLNDERIGKYALISNSNIDFPLDFDGNDEMIKIFSGKLLFCRVEEISSKEVKIFFEMEFRDYLEKAKNNSDSIICSENKLKRTDERSISFLKNKYNFLGQICSGCGFKLDENTECNDFYCYSDYAWVEDGICNVYFGGSLSGITFFYLFPFKNLMSNSAEA